MDNQKLRWKIFRYLIGFCGLLVLILWLMQTVFLEDMYKMIRKSEINQAISIVGKNIDNPNLQEIFKTLDQNKEIRVSPAKDFKPSFIRDDKNFPGKIKTETITKEQTFINAKGQEVSLIFHAIITPVDATVTTLTVQLMYITGIMLALSIALAWIMARRISSPIVAINEGAKKLSNGDYNANFEGSDYLEIKELADTLNTAAKELSKVEGLRREIMANISHDLRTPLALIYSYAEMMQDFPSEISSEQTQTIMDETRRLASLVDDVMDVSRLETGNITLHKEKYKLTESLEATCNRVANLLEKDKFNIVFNYDNQLEIVADEVKITQAFYNLLVNAVNYSGDSREIIVTQKLQDNKVVISVEDFGEGIPSENLPYIWQRYYKVDKNHKRPIIGTGLGLSIVQNIINLHGGECGVTSQFGEGSTFYFSVPLN